MATLYRFTDENGNNVYLEQRPTARGEIDVIAAPHSSVSSRKPKYISQPVLKNDGK